jgi:hypothetical protein
MAQEKVTARRIFTYDEAAALLPEVRRLTEEAQRQVEALHPRTDAESHIERIVVGWTEAVAASGGEVKGLWLVDFDNGSGYYCWRYPEDGLHYYHSYEDGFRGRMRIQ